MPKPGIRHDIFERSSFLGRTKSRKHLVISRDRFVASTQLIERVPFGDERSSHAFAYN
jgi:hypothetical protein